MLDTGASSKIDTTNIPEPVVGHTFGETGLMADAALEGAKCTKLELWAALDGSHAAGVVGASGRSSGSPLRWAIAGLAALAVLWVGYQFLFRGEQVEQAADRAVDTATRVGESARNLMVGDVDVGQEVTGWFDGVTKTLTEVTNAASAEIALPKLNELGTSLDKVGGLVEQLPAEGKSALIALVAAALPNLEALVAKVGEIPGAADGIKPVADSMLEKLRAMTT